MSFFIFLYVSVIGALAYMAYLYFPLLSKQIYVKYIFVSIISFFIWLLLYLVSFTGTINPDYILIYSKFLYILTFIGACSISGAFYFYGNKNTDVKKYSSHEKIIAVLLIGILGVSVFTDLFVKDVVFNEQDGVYVESFGFLFFIVQILYVLTPILSIFLSWKKYNELHGINRKRFLYLTFGYHIFIFLLLIFLGILPSFNIWVLQKEQVIFFIPFLFGLWYPLYRYRFGDITIGISKVIIFICSVICSTLLLVWSKNYLANLGSNFNDFWGISEDVIHFEYIAGFILFYVIYRSLLLKFTSLSRDIELQININKLKVEIPEFQNLQQLNLLLQSEFLNTLKIGGAKIVKLGDQFNFPELTHFFENNKRGDYFINDQIFIEENIATFSRGNISNELDPKVSLYFPLFGDDRKLIGIFLVGHKYLREYYTSDEIEILIDFSHFIAGHLKYLNIYGEIQELNLTLDKRVDEKTIEYNNLISRQKEFIAYLGHEVRNPITNTIFLGKDIQDEVDDLKKTDKTKNISEDIGILNDELLKIADLTKNIFSTEKLDLGKIKLYRSLVNIYDFISSEIVIMQKSYSYIRFGLEGKNIGEFEIDEVQFREVIHNLLTNATKYVTDKNGKILISLKKYGKGFEISIEDNGDGLTDIHIENIFEKYSTGDNDSIGLGMGLYLCKRIVELHGGTIHASNSKKLGGASFTIKI